MTQACDSRLEIIDQSELGSGKVERHIHLKLATNYEFKAAEASVKKKEKKRHNSQKDTFIWEILIFRKVIFFLRNL